MSAIAKYALSIEYAGYRCTQWCGSCKVVPCDEVASYVIVQLISSRRFRRLLMGSGAVEVLGCWGVASKWREVLGNSTTIMQMRQEVSKLEPTRTVKLIQVYLNIFLGVMWVYLDTFWKSKPLKVLLKPKDNS